MQIDTDRLILRPFLRSDIHEFKKLLDIPEIVGWQMQKNNATEFLNWHISNYKNMDIINGVVCLGIFDKETGSVLGAAGAGVHDDLQETEIFYQLLPAARGKGYATEAVEAITKWALENYSIPYIIGTTSIDNLASIKVLEKTGYEYIENKSLLVHITNNRHDFKYYRFYAKK